MVSLVKARKKAKEQKQKEGEAAQQTESQTPVAPEVSVPPQKGAVAVAEVGRPAAAPAASPVAAAAPSRQATNKLEEFKRNANQMKAAAREATAVLETVEVLELLLFNIAGEQYALPIEKIIEIITPRPATRVPNSDESVVGIISLRGTIVSILDIRRKLGHMSLAETTVDSRIIVVENDGETAGFLVDRVMRVVRVDPTQLESHPVVASSEQSEFIRGVFQHNQKLSILLDLERLLRF